MKNIVYLKTFTKNGIIMGYYIGCTKDFKKRMANHESSMRTGSVYEVHKAMRIYDHETKILYRFKTSKEAYEKESETIREYEAKGLKLLNQSITKETREKMSKKRKGVSPSNKGSKISKELKEKLSTINTGEKHPHAKLKVYYETNATTRVNFKTACKAKGWDFEEFVESFDHWSQGKNTKVKKYTYKVKQLL